MAKEVFANTREIMSKKSGTATVLGPIDVCHTPPPPPPLLAAKIGIPIPYPNFSKSKDLAKGTTTVKIKKKMVAQKNKSYIKKSKGNNTATNHFKKGILNRKITAKTYATSWSFDVRVQKKNVVRQGDSTKHNVS